MRIIGMNNGALFGTTTGSATLTDLDAGNTVPNSPIARAVIDPNNVNTAYVTLSAFNVVNVWKTVNLNNANPTWTAAAGSGGTAIPQVPVNAIVVSPSNSNIVFAGTDIGVYVSSDAGATWNPLGTGLPRVAVFGMAITSLNMLRIATHGRGMWEISVSSLLPIKWLAVNGNLNNQKQAIINWRVVESKVARYEVEKSTDGRNFSFLAIVSGKGDGENNYQFADPDILRGKAFYRIKQIDQDGRHSYSPVVKLSDINRQISVYPSPVKDMITVSVGNDLLNRKVLLLDVSGKILNSINISSRSFTVNVSNYSNGVYILKFENGASEKIIKE